MADAISIEETNKIRVAIGLKPLPVPGGGPTFKAAKDGDSSSEEEEQGSTLESRQAQGYDNWKNLQDQADAKARREAKNEAIRKARDAARKFAKLEGKGLGEADDVTETDTRTWLIQQKKRQKRIEKERLRKLEQELVEREQIADHTAEDLAGVKVGHELGDFEDGGEQVLTLKDTTIDENEEEGDELENLDLREREKLNEKLELKKKKPVYNPNDFDETGEKVLLKHYDETIDGKKRKRFTLDGQGTTAEEKDAMKQTIGERLRAQPITLETLRDAPISDYVDMSDIKIKKPKKKKPKSTRQRATDEEGMIPTREVPDENAMEIDSSIKASSLSGPRNEKTSLVDDDDLQAALARQRREALSKRKKMRPEDIARQVREEESATPGAEQLHGDGEVGQAEGGLVIDETSEFVANLQRPTLKESQPKSSNRRPSNVANPDAMSPSAADEDPDIDMDHSYNDDVSDSEDTKARETSTPAQSGLTITGLDDESTLNTGVGATLSLLSQRGLIKTAESGDINALHRERQKFLTEKQKREADAERKARLQRERDRASGKLDRMSAREREEYARWENKQRDQQESRQMAEIFNKEYKPDVQLKYTDEFGRSMNQKEAFKHLSHQFHGKGSGKQKTEKHLKKIEDEAREESRSMLDGQRVGGLSGALGATTKKNRTAGVRLA
ncbi:hypothetical protein MMC06_000647 [Schaereria dolodes]|nr:hypothetical protein [Schaereria dolodes]